MAETSGLTFLTFGQSFIVFEPFWTNLKTTMLSKVIPLQYEEDATLYQIFAIDKPSIVYKTRIWKGTVPQDVIDGGYSQAQNDSDKSDFETNYKPHANKPLEELDFNDPRSCHKLGNITTTATTEVLVTTRPYTAPGAQAQRSVVSTSATDSDTLGTGARQVRITYLDSNYILKTEDVLLSGLVAVNTVASDIRFIENFEVIKGAEAVGALRLMTGTNGGGTEICGISAATTQSFMCHHYIPAGKRAWIVGWGATCDDEANLKLLGQDRFGSNLVNITLDLENQRNGNLSPPNRLTFYRNLKAVRIPEKTYVRVTVVPIQATSTVTRAILDIWEDVT